MLQEELEDLERLKPDEIMGYYVPIDTVFKILQKSQDESLAILKCVLQVK